MGELINGIRVPFIPIVRSDEFSGQKTRPTADTFESLFGRELEKIKFSNHAIKRLESRSIELSDDQLTKLQTALERAEAKGAKDSLVMLENTAFIVNIPNRTVVTAMQVDGENENVFTNIDSVVFAH